MRLQLKMIALKPLIAVLFTAGFSIGFLGGEYNWSSDSYQDAGESLINLETISCDAYHKGQIQIKITPETSAIINSQLLTASESEKYIITGVESLDRLNSQFSVIEYRQLIYGLYDESSKSRNRIDLHREWGLDLWYDLSFDKSLDVIEVVKAFAELPEVTIAEPILIKVPIEPVETIEIQNNESSGKTRWIPNDPLFNPHQWNLRNTGQPIHEQIGTAGADIKATAAWDIEKGYNDVIVAVFDDGLSYIHEDIEGNVWELIGPQGTNTPRRDNGTRVAGIIAAETNNDRGIAGIAGGSGYADGVKIMTCNIVNTPVSYMSRKMYAADNGAAISQNNWRYVTPGQANQSDITAINYFNSNAGGNVLTGGVTIFAAGNENDNQDWYPPYLPQTIAVAATDNRDVKAAFSNYGGWIDLSAPGRHIPSIVGTDTYTVQSGSGMAAPHVSGVAALIISYTYRNGTILTNSMLRNILLTTTDSINDINPGYQGYLGSGRLNAYNALMNVQENYTDNNNPRNFTAVADTANNVNLNWKRNSEDNEVIIVWAIEPVLGRPEDGRHYQPGEHIPDVGEVLYWGFGTEYTHRNLRPGRRYYYKAFSVNYDMTYSRGVNATAAIDPPVFSLPFFEDFDREDVIPPLWKVIDQFNNRTVWKVGSFTGGLDGTEGNYAYFNGNDYQQPGTIGSQLISPLIDMSDAESVTLKFNHYFHFAPTNSTANLFVSTNGGITWSHISIWTQSTDNPATFEKIIPVLAGQQQVKIRWDFLTSNDGFWCIDNVEIFQTEKFPPVNFRATAGDSVITLTWEHHNPQEQHPFNIYRDGELINEQPIEDLIYVDEDVEQDIFYGYYATTVYPDGESLPTGTVYARIIPDDPEPVEVNPPRNLSASIQGLNVFLTWQIPDNMEPDSLLSYRIFRNGNIINTEPVTDTNYTDKELDPSEIYIYHLTTLYGEKESEPSDSVKVSFTANEQIPDTPVTFLEKNYPNPFNPETTISFSLAEPGDVTIEIYNLRGQKVKTILNQYLDKGHHQIVWNGKNESNIPVGSGLYLYRMQVQDYAQTRRMILIK